MKGWMVTTPGGPDVLELVEVPDPEPRDGWVLIAIRAFGLNRSELYTRQGHSGADVPFPRILGIECVGEVVDGGGTDLLPGQRVAAAMGQLGRTHHGGYAEFTSQPRSNVYPIETTLDWPTFGALPESYLTAWGAVMEAIDIRQDEALLVRGATSSVGMAAASIAAGVGATTIGTTRNEAKTQALLDAGFDHVVVDRGDVVEQVRSLRPDGVEGVVDLVGLESTITEGLSLCRPKATMCMVGFLGDTWDYQFFPWMPSTVNLTIYTSETLHEHTATPNLRYIVDQVQRGEYRANIDTVFDFADLVAAHRAMEANAASGKLVVVV